MFGQNKAIVQLAPKTEFIRDYEWELSLVNALLFIYAPLVNYVIVVT